MKLSTRQLISDDDETRSNVKTNGADADDVGLRFLRLTFTPNMPKLLSQVPWRISPRPGLESRSTIDYILQPLFLVSYVYLSFTLVRLFWALTLLPIYLLLAFLRSVWPALLRNGGLLLTSKGRARLIQDGHQTFADRERQGEQQFSDDYRFPAGSFEHGWQHNGPPGNLAAIWPVNREYINVCGLKACVVHEKPAGPVVRTVVLLHGNPSWSFMFRHVSLLLMAVIHCLCTDHAPRSLRNYVVRTSKFWLSTGLDLAAATSPWTWKT